LHLLINVSLNDDLEGKVTTDIYQNLCKTLAQRGGRYPGVDIPEFYALVEKLFTVEEAEVYCAIPRGFNSAITIAKAIEKPADEVAAILETMADKGLCTTGIFEGVTFYGAPLLVPGIFEYQFMRGTRTEKDRKLAKLIYEYKAAVDKIQGPPKVTFPTTRVIPVDKKIEAGNTIHTYNQVAAYIEKYEPLSVSTCFCRHEAKLIDPADHCGKPDDVCMQFGASAQFIIDRNMGRQVTKDEALKILQVAEEAGLVHASLNRQEIDFLCNCCSCHCVILKTALAQPKPGVSLNSGFQPVWDDDLCTACETCIANCPTGALTLGDQNVPEVDLDRCIGCGVCASGCPEDAIALETRADIEVPPVDRKALRAAVKASGSQGI
jgi:Pyruvate/2-oxoacid:ferredoxin oxidoreductase delta subunit